MFQILMNASPFHVRMAATVLMGSPVIRATAFPVIPVITAKRVCQFFCVWLLLILSIRYW